MFGSSWQEVKSRSELGRNLIPCQDLLKSYQFVFCFFHFVLHSTLVLDSSFSYVPRFALYLYLDVQALYQAHGLWEWRDWHETLKECSKNIGMKKAGEKVAGSGKQAHGEGRMEKCSSQSKKNRCEPLKEGLQCVKA